MTHTHSMATYVEGLPAIGRLLVGFYGRTHGLPPAEIAARIVLHFVERDDDLDAALRARAIDSDLSIPAQGAEWVWYYAQTHTVAPSDVLTGIVVEFVLSDADFDLEGFRGFVERQWGVSLPGRPDLAAIEQLAGTHGAPPMVSSQKPICPALGRRDVFKLREPAEDARIGDWFEHKVGHYRCPADLGPPERALRGIHARGLGALRGTLAMDHSHLPSEAPRLGVFADVDTPHEVILRYSTSGGPHFEAMPDDDGQQAVGLGLKVLSPDGATRHDLLFINSPTFLTNDPVSLVFREGEKSAFEREDAPSQTTVSHVLDETLYTASAYSWGEDAAVKYGVFPTHAVRDVLTPEDQALFDEKTGSIGRTGLSDALQWLVQRATRPIELTLAIQFADPDDAASHGCPTDDERIEWKTPWCVVGTLRIPPQAPLETQTEALAFDPFHVSHRGLLPLGRLNRARLSAYARSRRGRHHHNKVDNTPHPYQSPDDLRVAVIGGGASGLSAALALASFGYQVTVFERNAELGGHACVKDVFDGQHRRDPAFGAFRARQWPNLWALLETLGVDPISHGQADDWFDSPFAGWFARDAHPIERTATALEEARRVIVELTKALRDPDTDGRTIGELFDELEVSPEYLTTGFLGGVIHYFAGHPLATYLNYPLRLIAWMWLNNAARAGDEPIELFRVKNDVYMARFRERLESLGVVIRTRTQAQIVGRSPGAIRLRIHHEDTETEAQFDRLVLAIQPQHALTVLGDQSRPDETRLLGAFEHTRGTVVVHQDARWMPSKRVDWSLFNVMLPDADAPAPTRDDTVPITIYKPCTRDDETALFATYAYGDTLDFAGPTDRFTFEHLSVTPHTQRLRAELGNLQGHDGIHFCGSWSRGLTLHEDAIVTGFEAANRILGPDRQYGILQPPVPLPAPFEASDQGGDGDALGGGRPQLLAQLQALLTALLGQDDTVELTEETALQDLLASSLHLARLANALDARMPADADLDVSSLLHIETIGELIDTLEEALGGGQFSALDADPTAGRRRLDSAELTGTGHPISCAQEGILTSHFLTRQGSAQWNISMARWFVGPLDDEALKATFVEVADRHSALRTRFVPEGTNRFTQWVEPALPPDFFFAMPASSEDEVRMMARAQIELPMDVTRGVLRVRLLRTSPERALMVMVIHHAVADGWSLGIMLRDFIAGLNARLAGLTPKASPPVPQMVDAARWERDALEAGAHGKAVDYWRHALARPLPPLERGTPSLVAPHIRPIALAGDTVDGVRALARQWKTSFNTVLITAYAAILGRRASLTTQDTLLVRLPSAARTPESEGIFGCFADALVLRVPCRGARFKEAVRHVHEALYAGLEHPVPFTVLWRELGLSRRELLDLNQVILNLEQGVNVLNAPRALSGSLTTEPYGDPLRPQIEPGAIRSMLSLNEGEGGIVEGEWLWSDDVADATEGRRLLIDGLNALLSRVVETQGQCSLDADDGIAVEAPGCPFLDHRQDLARDARDFETLTGWYDAAQATPSETVSDVALATATGQFIAGPMGADAPGTGIFDPESGPAKVLMRWSIRFGAGGLALKVHADGRTRHDLLFLTTTTIPNDPVRLVSSAGENAEHGGPDALFQPYYSISPYSWGASRAVKYRLQPRPDQTPATVLAPVDLARYRALAPETSGASADQQARLAFVLAHARAPIVLELAIQHATHPELTPVDDTLVEWTTPYANVAEIELPPQSPETAPNHGLRFHPFHVSDAAYLPLGRLNRFRREVYDYTTADAPAASFPYDPPESLRVGVVGGGASGLSAALTLADFGYAVTVFEKSAEVGGHAATKSVLGGKHLREPAFGAFRRAQWPNFVALLDTLGVEPVSHGQSHEWFDSPFVGWRRPGGEAVSPSPAVEDEARRFIAALTGCLDDPAADGKTVGELITELGLSPAFLCTWFAGGVIHYFAGHPLSYYLAYPARLLAWMWLNNAERADGEPVEILRVDNAAYMHAFDTLLQRKGVRVCTHAEVTVTARDAGRVTLRHQTPDSETEEHRLGTLVLAIQPHHALTVLDAFASPDEQAVLGAFTHTTDRVKIHSDAPTLGPIEGQKLLNIVLPAAGAPWPNAQATLPMIIKKNCARDGVTPIYATYDYAHTADDKGPDVFPFEHVQVTPQTQRLRQRLTGLQGLGSVHFCGSWSRGLTLHEDAIVSAFQTVNRVVGPGRAVEILDGPIPQPVPFAETASAPSAQGFGESPADILASLVEILATVMETDLPQAIDAETNLQDIHLSSLHFARLANAISARLPSDLRDEMDIVMLLQMETVGELRDYLYDQLNGLSDGVDPDLDAPPPAPLPPPPPGRRDFTETLTAADESALPIAAVAAIQGSAIVALLVGVVSLAHLALFGLARLEPYGWPALVAGLPLAYLGYALGFAILAIAVKRTVVGTLRPGRFPIYGPTHLRWWVANLFLRFGQQTIWAALAESHFGGWMLRRLGGAVHPSASASMAGILSSISLVDSDLLTLAEGAYIRPHGRVRAHMFIDGELVLAPVRLGAGSTVWSRALVEPGAVVSAGAGLDAHSVLVMGHAVPAGELWRGIPAQPTKDAVPPTSVSVSALERWTHTLTAVVGFPIAVAALLAGWFTLIRAVFPGASINVFDPLLWLLAYPLWLTVTMVMGVFAVGAKWIILGRLTAGDTEESRPIALPMVRLMTMGLRRLALLWPRGARWAVLRGLGAQVSPQGVTEEPFLDWGYADLFTRAQGAFFSPAAFVDFAQPTNGARTLGAIELVTGAYVGAYSTLSAPLETRPMSIIAGCSSVAPGTVLADEEAWVGAPARRVPIRVGEVSLDAFKIPAGVLRRLRLFENTQRYVLFTILTGITWASLLLLGRTPGFTTGIDAAVLTLGHLALTLGATWAIFVPLLRLEGSILRRAVRRSEELAQEGLGRDSWLFLLWGTTVFHMIPVALTTEILAGTPFRALMLRFLGARVGTQVYLDHEIGLSEFPFLDIEDAVVVNEGAALIGHSELPNGRIAFKGLRLGAHSSVLWSGYLVGGTDLPAHAVLGSLSRPFDGQRLQPDGEYDNTPCRRQGAP